MAGLQSSTCRYGAGSNGNESYTVVFFPDYCTSFSDNCPGDTSSMLKVGVCCINDGINLHFRDIALHDLDNFHCSSAILSNPRINLWYFFCAFATVVFRKRILLLPGTHCASKGRCAVAIVPIVG